MQSPLQALQAREDLPDYNQLFTDALNGVAKVHEAEIALLRQEIMDLRCVKGSEIIPSNFDLHQDGQSSPSNFTKLQPRSEIQSQTNRLRRTGDSMRSDVAPTTDSSSASKSLDSDLSLKDSKDKSTTRMYIPRQEFGREVSDLQSQEHQQEDDFTYSLTMQDMEERHEVEEKYEEGQRRSKFVLHPNSKLRFAMDALTAMFILNDAFAIPAMLAFTPANEDVFRIWVLGIAFWNMDMVVNFVSGFYSEGEPVLDVRMIAWRYFRSYFFFDLSVNMIDVLLLMYEMSRGRHQQGPGLMLLLRFTRCVRTLRAAILVNRIKENLRAHWMRSRMQMFGLGSKLALILLWLNHVACCFWYFLGRNGGISDTGYTWLDMEMLDGETYRNATTLYQYFTSLHWSVTQMTPGSMEVVPQNSIERAFNVACLVCGLFAGALLVSQLSAQQMRILNDSKEHEKRMQDLRLFFRQNNINWVLRARVHGQIQERLSVQKRLTEDDVPLLEVLSITLRCELLRDAFNPYIMTHTVFFLWDHMNRGLIRAMCGKALSFVCISHGDDLFTPLTVADKMYYVIKGSLKYMLESDIGARSSSQSLGAVESNDSDLTFVQAGSWISEVALWMDWSYSGVLEAIVQCELLCVHSSALLPLLKKYPKVRRLSVEYCAAFATLVREKPHMAFDLSIDCAEVLQVMDLKWRHLLMSPLLHRESLFDHAESSKTSILRWKATNKLREELRNELQEGRCIISLTTEGMVQRTVVLCAIRIVNAYGKTLVRLGKHDTTLDQFVTRLSLPGTKLLPGETPEKAMQRCLREDLPQYAEVDCGRVTSESTTGNSERYGLPTTYLKVIFSAYLDDTSSEDSSIEDESISPFPDRTTFNGRFQLDNLQLLLATDCKNETYLYAWMKQEDFEEFSSSNAGECLTEWFSTDKFKMMMKALEAKPKRDKPRPIPKSLSAKKPTLVTSDAEYILQV